MDIVAGILNKLIVATPFLLVTTVGFNAREHKENFKYTACTVDQERDTDAYIPFVSRCEKIFANSNYTLTPASVKLAQDWVAASDAGILKRLPDISIDDSSRDGVKSEIIRDVSHLASALNFNSQELIQQKKYDAAIRENLLCMQLLRVPRLFDFSSMSVCSLLGRRALGRIEECLPKVNSTIRESALHELAALKVSREQCQELSLEARANLLKEEDSPNVQHEDFSRIESYISVTRTPTLAQLKDIGSEPLSDSSNEDIVDMVDEFRLGYSAALDMNQMISHIEAAKGEPEPVSPHGFETSNPGQPLASNAPTIKSKLRAYYPTL